MALLFSPTLYAGQIWSDMYQKNPSGKTVNVNDTGAYNEYYYENNGFLYINQGGVLANNSILNNKDGNLDIHWGGQCC